MRHIQVTIPIGKRETVLDLLDEEGIEYVVTDESSSREYDAVVSFPVPTNAGETDVQIRFVTTGGAELGEPTDVDDAEPDV